MNKSKDFISFLIKMNNGLSIDEVRDDIKDCIIDYLACTYAGSKIIGEKIEKLISFTVSPGNSPLIGLNKKTSPSSAALINAMMAHSTELDDGHRFAMLHIEASIVSALISAVSSGLVKGSTAFLKGIVIGYEVTCRLAQAMQPGHKIKGFHGTGTCATCGAALAIGFAAGYTEEELNNTLSAAVASASGLLEMIDSPSQLKPFTVGNSAKNGYIAACIGKAGFVGPNDPLFGKRGFFNAFADEVNLDELFIKEKSYKIQQRYTKPYASCRHCHPATEAVLNIIEQNSFELGLIERIDVETYKLAIFGHDSKTVDSVSAAKMSMPFSIATALVNGEAGFNAYSEDAINNEAVKNIANKVYINESDDFNSAFPKKRGATVRIKTNDSQVFVYKVEYPLGEPENPMNREAIVKKFYQLGNYADKNNEQLNSVLNLTLNIEDYLNNWIELINN